jgi:outer membrane protein assembly factor BamB
MRTYTSGARATRWELPRSGHDARLSPTLCRRNPSVRNRIESRAMLRPYHVLALIAASCHEPGPMTGAGPSATATASEPSAGASAGPASQPSIVTHPNGMVVITDPQACRLEAFVAGERRWAHQLSGCGGILEAVAAADSASYVRTAATLAAFEPDGGQRWSTLLEQSALPAPLLSPTTLADSRAAVALSPRKMVVYEHDGRVGWSYSSPSDESFVAPPMGMKTEGVIVSTSRATYLLSATGEIRWRTPRVAAIEER